jgi:hypothetical protein
MRKIGDRSRCRIYQGLASGMPHELCLLYARFLELEAGDSIRTWRRLALGKMFESFPDAFVIALTMVAAAEIFVEQPSQRPQVLSAVLAAHYSCALP